MKKALFYGIIASFFFAFTFVLNRSMNLNGGSFLWSASLRYFFTLPILFLLLQKKKNWTVFNQIKKQPFQWLLWSTVGFGLFYAPLTLASIFGESWLAAASWQLTIVAGVLLTPFFGHRIPYKNLLFSCIILVGIFLLQFKPDGISIKNVAGCLIPTLIAAFSYPLGNRKMMALCKNRLDVFSRTFGMALCSMPFWIILSIVAFLFHGFPSGSQLTQSFLVALFSGVIATLLFFRATDLVQNNPKKLAVIEATQSGEVIFTLLLGILFLGDALPSPIGAAGLLLVIGGMTANSLSA